MQLLFLGLLLFLIFQQIPLNKKNHQLKRLQMRPTSYKFMYDTDDESDNDPQKDVNKKRVKKSEKSKQFQPQPFNVESTFANKSLKCVEVPPVETWSFDQKGFSFTQDADLFSSQEQSLAFFKQPIKFEMPLNLNIPKQDSPIVLELTDVNTSKCTQPTEVKFAINIQPTVQKLDIQATETKTIDQNTLESGYMTTETTNQTTLEETTETEKIDRNALEADIQATEIKIEQQALKDMQATETKTILMQPPDIRMCNSTDIEMYDQANTQATNTKTYLYHDQMPMSSPMFWRQDGVIFDNDEVINNALDKEEYDKKLTKQYNLTLQLEENKLILNSQIHLLQQQNQSLHNENNILKQQVCDLQESHEERVKFYEENNEFNRNFISNLNKQLSNEKAENETLIQRIRITEKLQKLPIENAKKKTPRKMYKFYLLLQTLNFVVLSAVSFIVLTSN